MAVLVVGRCVVTNVGPTPVVIACVVVVDARVGQDAVTGGVVRADQAGQAAGVPVDPGAGGEAWGAPADGAAGAGGRSSAAAEGVPAEAAAGDRAVGGGDRRLAARGPEGPGQATAP